MAATFDPYYSWLGIPPADQPADYYRVLGIKRFEDSREVIANAAERQICYVESFKDGEHAKDADKLLHKLVTAKACLLDLEQKRVYDQAMRGAVTGGKSAENVSNTPTTRSKAVASRSRVRAKSPLIEIATIVLGGIAGLVIGNAVLWYGFGLDVLGVMDSREARTANSLAQNDAEMQPKSPRYDQNDLEAAEEKNRTDSDARHEQVVEPATTERDESAVAEPMESARPDGVEQASPVESDEASGDARPQASAEGGTPPAEPTEAIETRSARSEVPSLDSLATAEATVRSIFADEYASAKTPLEKTDLAGRLLNIGLDTHDDMASRFVTLRSARNVAVEGGNVDLSFRAIDALLDSFEMDGLAEQARLAGDLVKVSLNDEEVTKLKLRLVELREQAFDRDDYAIAAKLNDLGRGMGKGTDKRWIETTDLWSKRIESCSTVFELVQQAIQTLESSPEDATANLTIGRYRCLLKGEWQIGLPYLAKGSDEKLRAIAESEMATSAPTSNETLALADAWWDLAAELGEIEGLLECVRN